jgi:hypothetical protein
MRYLSDLPQSIYRLVDSTFKYKHFISFEIPLNKSCNIMHFKDIKYSDPSSLTLIFN